MEKNIETLKSELKELSRSWAAEHDRIAESSRLEYMKNLKPNELAPKQGVCYGDAFISEAKGRVQKYKEDALQKIDSYISEANETLMTPPSEEALRTIQALKLAGKVSSDDLARYVNQYGDNYTCHKVLSDIGVQNKCYIAPHKGERELHVLETMREQTVNHFMAAEMNVGRLNVSEAQTSPGMYDFGLEMASRL